MDKADLYFAFEFVCNECGQINYVSAINREVREENDFDEEETYSLVEPPTHVACAYCDKEYEVNNEEEDNIGYC